MSLRWCDSHAILENSFTLLDNNVSDRSWFYQKGNYQKETYGLRTYERCHENFKISFGNGKNASKSKVSHAHNL